MAANQTKSKDQVREGLMLCMLLVVVSDGLRTPDELREVTLAAFEEPEFAGSDANTLRGVFEAVQKDLQAQPGRLSDKLKKLLPEEEQRRRGLVLATRVAVADGIIGPEHVEALNKLTNALGLTEEDLGDCIMSAQRQLARFMMLYLVYLTASRRGRLSSTEFEAMVPLLLSQPIFHGVTTDRFAHLSQSVRGHLDTMREDGGLDYICGTLKKAAELLEEPSLPEQALKVVARGLMADGKIATSERDFFATLADKLGAPIEKKG